MPEDPAMDPVGTSNLAASGSSMYEQDIDERGYVAFGAMMDSAHAVNPLCTPDQLMTLATRCKNDAYVSRFKVVQAGYTATVARLAAAEAKLGERAGPRVMTLLKGTRRAVKQRADGSVVIGRKYKVGRDAGACLLAFSKMEHWKYTPSKSVRDQAALLASHLRVLNLSQM